jgi:hypothetical protein
MTYNELKILMVDSKDEQNGRVGTVGTLFQTFSITTTSFQLKKFRVKTIPTVPYLCGVRVCWK